MNPPFDNAMLSSRIIQLEQELIELKAMVVKLYQTLDPSDLEAIERLEIKTPSNAELLRLAQQHAPPQAWFDSAEEPKFW